MFDRIESFLAINEPHRLEGGRIPLIFFSNWLKACPRGFMQKKKKIIIMRFFIDNSNYAQLLQYMPWLCKRPKKY